VPKALKIHTPDDSGEISGPKENPIPEKEVLVERDQGNSAEGGNEGMPQDNTTPVVDDAPSLEKKDGPQANPDNQDDKVTSNPLLLLFLQISLTV
jgi:hypothetical protein